MQRIANRAASPTGGRMPVLDVVKGLACCLIVWHHLAFYGPMSDTAYALVPDLMQWLYDYGRMAVQVFLVLGGYLAAASLAPNGQARSNTSPWMQIGRRYLRLVLPYLVALVVCIVVSAGIRMWSHPPAVPGAPDWPQLLAHVLLLQNALGYESLSAGVWYVSIDFQLFALTVGLLALARWLQAQPGAKQVFSPGLLRYAAPGVVLALTVASLLWFNRDSDWDSTALYFMGAYGLGMLTFWVTQDGRSRHWLWLLIGLGVLALWVDFRGRILVALVTALALWCVGVMPALQRWNGLPMLQRLGQMSYSVFLIHFSVCLLVNQLVDAIWPELPWHNLAGMVAAFVLSLVCGRALYVWVEQRSNQLVIPSWHVPAGGMVAALLLMTMAKAVP